MDEGTGTGTGPTLPQHRGAGQFVFDNRWRCIDCCPAAERMLAYGWWRRTMSGVLDAGHPTTQRAWANAQRIGVNRPTGTLVFPVLDTQGRTVALARLSEAEAGARNGTGRQRVLHVRSLADCEAEALRKPLHDMYGLTPAEVSLAVALYRQGDLAHAAAEQHIAPSSARTRLQSIFDKTNTHRLGKLLLLIGALADLVV